MLNVRQLGMSDVCERLLNVGLNFGRRFVERHKELSPKKKKESLKLKRLSNKIYKHDN
jgi:hypothetical protein